MIGVIGYGEIEDKLDNYCFLEVFVYGRECRVFIFVLLDLGSKDFSRDVRVVV